MAGTSQPWTGFLGDLGAPERTALQSLGRVTTLPAGRCVFGEGESAGTLAVLLDGRLKVLTTTRDGVELLLAIRGPGDLLGELSTLIGAVRSATVIAIEPVRLLVVPAADFERLLVAEPTVASTLIKTLVERLREAMDVRAELCEEVPMRVGRLLLRLADRFGSPTADGATLIDLPLTQEELASLASASRGGLAGALRDLRDRGLIRTARRQITVLDVERLRTLAQ